MIHKGAAEARNQLPHLLDAAEKGESTVISKHGRPVAVLATITAHSGRQEPLTPVAGSGRGLWGKNGARAVRKLRDEWSR
jgi:prevent-host-death family protein